MKTEYGISTKDKEISYLKILDSVLYTKLGLKPAMSGTRYLRELILYIYDKKNYDYMVEKEIKAFLKDKGLNTNFRTIKSKITYAINNGNGDVLKRYFFDVFQTEYDSYFISIKNIINAIIILLEKNSNN